MKRPDKSSFLISFRVGLILTPIAMILNSPSFGRNTSVPEPRKISRTVEVSGRKFKVKWRGTEAEVSAVGMFFRADLNLHLSEIRAAEIVSGCHATDHFEPGIGIMVVQLEC